MDPATRRLIEALHCAPFQCVLALTGGGTSAAGLLLSVPGGSRTVLEVVVPYHQNALDDFLGRRPEQYCSAATGIALAERAWERAGWLLPREAVAGVGCTATLATDRPKRGDHHFHIAIRTDRQTMSWALTLAKDARDREAEEQVLTAVLLNALAECSGVGARVPVPLLPGEEVRPTLQSTPDPLSVFLTGGARPVSADGDGRLSFDAAPPSLLLPGSFNPLHAGHRLLARVAAEQSGKPVVFEMSVTNVDKPALAVEEVRYRLRQFAGRDSIWLTKAPTFLQKAELFPGVTFVVGVDTAERIIAPRYYQGSEERMLQCLERLRSLGCRFLVAGRSGADGKFVAGKDLALPAAQRDLFTIIPESAFRHDLSSTQLRGAVKSGTAGSE